VTRSRQLSLQGLLDVVSSNARSLTGLLLVAVLASTMLLGKQWLSDPWRFPLNVVEVKGDFRYLDKQVLQAAVAPHATGGFFTVDVAAIRTAAEQLPWVHKASVKRVWPETLRLQIEEQQPVAHWGADGFLNKRGEPFAPRETDISLTLPSLAGPDGLELKVLENFKRVSETLAPLGIKVTRMELDNRRSWHLQLDNAVLLELGRADNRQRLQRFVRAYPNIFAGRLNELQRVDLRYSNGFSVYWKQAVLENATGKQG
jgi:cell division protein FtsQ